MTIQDALDNYEDSRYSKYFDEPPYMLSEIEAFAWNDCWITPDGEIIGCGYAEHQSVIKLLNDLNAVDLMDEYDAELKGWVKVSDNSTHICYFPVKKPVQDIILMHFAFNGNKLWLCGGHYEFRDIEKLKRWLDGGEYEHPNQ